MNILLSVKLTVKYYDFLGSLASHDARCVFQESGKHTNP